MDTEQSHDLFAGMMEKANGTFWEYLGCEMISMDAGKVVVGLDVKKHHLNLLNILHGGVHSSLLDSAMGLVAMASRPGESMVTSNLNIHFTAPVRLGRVTGEAEILHMSGKMITTQGTITDGSGTLCAVATASFRVIDKK